MGWFRLSLIEISTTGFFPGATFVTPRIVIFNPGRT